MNGKKVMNGSKFFAHTHITLQFFSYLCDSMNNRQKETLRVRIISVGFTCLAFAVFKPIGIGELGASLYLHLIAIWLLGVGICYVTEFVMKYIVNMPATLDKGVDYIIRRNLWFQLVNSPLEALMTCLYLHFPMTKIGAADPLSWKGFIQAVFVMAFCSFSIGLYWRYKYRSRYLAMELEETKMLNEDLQRIQEPEKDSQPSSSIVLSGTTNESVSLQVSNLLYIEAVGNYVKVYHMRDDQVVTDMLRATSKQMEDKLRDYPMIVRCHRAFLVNLEQVQKIVSQSGTMQLLIRHSHESIHVSRSNVTKIKNAIKQMT